LGSNWYSSHTVPEKAIAVLNGDMIGRNDINQAALLGSTAPHENSADLVAVAKRANEEGTKFDLDKLWDKPEHQSIGTLGLITFLMLVEAFAAILY
jgi:hypothetical protein